MFDFKTFNFGSGSHRTREEGMCVMEAVAYVSGEMHSDKPDCACPVISAFLRSWNDSLRSDAERNRLLARFVFRLVGTKSTMEIENVRGMMALKWLIKVFTPAMLELVPCLKDHAKILRELIVNKDNEKSVVNTLSAARSAAESAAESAPRSAPRSASWSAAESAAWSAAKSAALSAAWIAALSAAESAAWSAAKSAALSAAWIAALSAAESGARSAAESAAEKFVEPTVKKLQKSALHLVDKMIRLTEPKELSAKKRCQKHHVS